MIAAEASITSPSAGIHEVFQRGLFNMTNEKRRAIELEFYCIIQLIYSIEKNANFLMCMLEGLHFIADFNVEKIINYANKFNINPTWYPYQGEVVGMLYKHSDLPMNAVCKAMQISRVTGYKLASEYLKDPPEPIPKIPIEDIPDVQAVVTAYKILKGTIKNNG